MSRSSKHSSNALAHVVVRFTKPHGAAMSTSFGGHAGAPYALQLEAASIVLAPVKSSVLAMRPARPDSTHALDDMGAQQKGHALAESFT